MYDKQLKEATKRKKLLNIVGKEELDGLTI